MQKTSSKNLPKRFWIPLGIGLPVCAFILEWLLQPSIALFPWLLFFLAVVISARLGDARAGWLSAGTSMVLVNGLMLPLPSLVQPQQILANLIFLANAWVVNQWQMQPATETIPMAHPAEETSPGQEPKDIENLRLVVNSIQDIIFTLDTEQRHTGIYGKWAENAGVSPEYFLGRTARDILGEGAVVHEEANQRALAGEYVMYEWELNNQGKQTHYKTSLSPIYNKENQITGLVGIGRDITQNKELEKSLQDSEQNLHVIFETMSEGIALNEAIYNENHEMIDYRIALVNKAFYSVADFRGSQVIGNTATRLYGMNHNFIKEFWQEHRLKNSTAYTEMYSPLGARCYYVATSPFVNDRFVTSFFDITELKNMERALRESEEKLRNVFNNMEEGMAYNELVFNEEGNIVNYRILEVNAAYETITGLSREFVIGKLATDIYPTSLDDIKNFWQTSIHHEQATKADLYIEEIGRWLHVSISKLSGSKFVTLFFDNTEQKKAEISLRESEERHQVFISQSFEAIYRTEFDQPIDTSLPVEEQIDLIYAYAYMAECNQAMASMYNLPSPEAFLGVRLVDAHGGKDNPINRAAFRKLIENGYKSINDETLEYTADGQPVWFLSNTIGVIADGKIVRLWGTSIDITERKGAEEQLKKSLLEKETLLRELYHRTKNNMAVIIALLELQSSGFEDPIIRTAFTEAENRIRSMALVHQKLYETKNLSRLNLKEYTQTLIQLMMDTYNLVPGQIAVQAEMEDVEVLIDTAIPCGLILNELISNALKYAFPNGQPGTLSVLLRKTENGIIEMHFADNGIGTPAGFDFRRDGHLGIQSIFMLVEGQLQGTISFENKQGLICRFSFQDSLYQPRV